MMIRARQIEQSDVPTLRSGVVVGVRISGVWHEGLVEQEQGGQTWIWNKSKRTGRVERESWQQFAPPAHRVIEIGYLGELSPEEVIERARQRQGEEWTPIANCQQFTRQCHGVRRAAPDIDRVAFALLLSMLGGPL